MQTPPEFNRLIDNGIVTTEIIATVIYSLNKRAKNWRDTHPDLYNKAKQVRNWKLLGIEEGRKEFKKYRVLEYYQKKDYLLIKLFKPAIIHIIDGVEHLYYEIHKSGFHMPVYVYELYGFQVPKDIEKKVVDDFFTTGEDTETLVSIQFCNKVFSLIQSRGYIFIEGGLFTGYPDPEIRKRL